MVITCIAIVLNLLLTERTLEDHEDILAVHRELEMFTSHYERRFYFSEDFLKYELFINPKVRERRFLNNSIIVCYIAI